MRVAIVVLFLLAANTVRADSVGVATMVIGSPAVVIDEEKTALTKGAEVRSGSRIVTGAGSHAHLRFNDGTLVSVRPNSELAIVAFEQDGLDVISFRLELTSGSTRTVSGDGLKRSRQNFRLNTPIAAIGIRGTDFTTLSLDRETQVEVHSGEVVMAPFAEGCSAEALGPCSTQGSVSLAAGTKEIMSLRTGATVPEIIQLGLNGERSQALRQVVKANQEPNDAVGSDEVVLVNRISADEQVVPLNAEPKPFTDTDDDLAEQRGALVWGHWFSVPTGDTWSQPATSLIGAFDPTVSNAVYGLFRDPSHAGPMAPARSSVALGLTAAEASFSQDGSATKARVSEGVLLLDFGNQSFVSKMSVDTDRAGLIGLEGAGIISPSGIFVSKSTSDRMAGAITNDGLEAGMLFEKKVGTGTVQGISLWSH